MGENRSRRLIFRVLVAFAAAFVVLSFVRTWVADVYSVASISMAPTLRVGDRVVVSRSAYGWRLPFAGERMSPSLPERGDVIVFVGPVPEGGERVQVKRVMGLPGDRIRFENKQLLVNGEPLRREPVAEVRLDGDGNPVSRELLMADSVIHREFSGNGRSHQVLERKAVQVPSEGPWIVPYGHLFVLGDNRDESLDSRPPRGYGAVPLDRVLGRVSRVVAGPADPSRARWSALD